MAETSIEWTDATWNPVAGCTVLTAGCTNCYAMRMPGFRHRHQQLRQIGFQIATVCHSGCRIDIDPKLNVVDRDLVVAKLDRLSRDVHFISGLMSHKVPFIVTEQQRNPR